MKRLLKFTLLLALLLATGLIALMIYAYGEEAVTHQVFLNGDVVDANGEQTEALYVVNGRIQALGSEPDVLLVADKNAAIVDLQQGALLPGLIEPHTHPIATALLAQAVDVSGFSHQNREQIMQTLREAVADFSPNGWVIAFGWDPVMLPDLEAPTLAELDALSPDKPLLILTQMMHDAYVNSVALNAANITPQTPNPKGGEFIKDADGKLTGTIREVPAISHLFNAVPKPPNAVVTALTQLQLQQYAKAGYTSLGVLGPVGRADDPLAILETLLDRSDAPLRARTWALPDQLPSTAKPAGNNRYGVRGVKFWMDGSPFAGGAAWEEPYENSELALKRLELPRDHMAHLNYELDDFAQQFADYHQRGFSIAVHVQGERAVDAALDMAEQGVARYPRDDHRHRLEHNALITPQQIQRAKQLGFTLSFFVDHIWFYGHSLPDLIGERSDRYMPVGSALKSGHRVTLHGDHPATPLDPLRTLKTAVTRAQRSQSGDIAPNQALTVAQALKAMTIDAAWQLGIEAETGSLAVGKAADFVWLSQNPLTVDPQKLDEITVRGTWVAGQAVDTKWNSRANARLLLESIF